MIDDFLFSIAGKKVNPDIDEVLEGLLQHPDIPHHERAVLEYVQRVAAEGKYPSRDYFKEQGYAFVRTTKSTAEIRVMGKEVQDFWSQEALQRKTVTAINESGSHSELLSRLQELASESLVETQSELGEYVMELPEGEFKRDPNGYRLNIDEVDQVTGGFQPGTVASVCAFTSQGKSTLAVSSAYFNIKKGRCGVLFSLEVTPDLVLRQFYSRWLFEEKSLEITPKSMMDGSLSDEQEASLQKYKSEFNAFIRGKLLIVDEALLTSSRIKDFKSLSRLYRSMEDFVNSLDWVIFDHINQIELMFERLGNTFIRTLTSSTKTFVNKRGLHPVTLMCVQCNRDGYRRAQRRNGKYDMLAVSELNEVERSSTYVLFMYTSDDMKLLQETKVMMPKHRLGAVVTEPLSIAFNAASFVVGETVETVSFLGNLDFLNSGDGAFTSSDFTDFD